MEPQWSAAVVIESTENGGSLLEKLSLIKIKETINKIQNIDTWKEVCYREQKNETCSSSSIKNPLDFLNTMGNQIDDLQSAT